MSVTYAAVTEQMDVAVAAMLARDYAAARDAALAAQAILSALPDTTRSSGGGGSQGLTWDRVAISQFVDRCQRLCNASVGMTSSQVVIQPLNTGDCR